MPLCQLAQCSVDTPKPSRARGASIPVSAAKAGYRNPAARDGSADAGGGERGCGVPSDRDTPRRPAQFIRPIRHRVGRRPAITANAMPEPEERVGDSAVADAVRGGPWHEGEHVQHPTPHVEPSHAARAIRRWATSMSPRTSVAGTHWRERVRCERGERVAFPSRRTRVRP